VLSGGTEEIMYRRPRPGHDAWGQVIALESRLALGRGIAEQRRRRGWTQPELAAMLGRPVAWVSQLERGLVPAGPAPVPRAVVSALLPAEPAGGLGAGASRAELASALRLVLAGSGSLRTGTRSPGEHAGAALAAKAAEVWALTTAGRYGDLAGLLSDLLPALESAVRDAPDQQRAGLHQLMSGCYQACAAALARLGDDDSALAAAGRAMAAAHRAGDVLSTAASGYLQVCVLMEARRHEEAGAIAVAAADAVRLAAAGGSMDAVVLRGALTLLLALIAARAGNLAAAEDQLGRARVMAGRLSRAAGSRGAGFGPDQVALYEMAVRIEAAGPRASGAEGDGL
jgi:transcriptional regulator with XRE-family HTH domain